MHRLDLTDVEEKVEGPFAHLARVGDCYIASKVENQEQVEFIKSLGVSLAIDLKESGETDFDDSGAFEQLGVEYAHFPISDVSSLEFEGLCRFEKLLGSAEGPKLIYCMSGNRVSALLALKLVLVCGHPKQRALDLAMRVGLIKEGLIQKVQAHF